MLSFYFSSFKKNKKKFFLQMLQARFGGFLSLACHFLNVVFFQVFLFFLKNCHVFHVVARHFWLVTSRSFSAFRFGGGSEFRLDVRRRGLRRALREVSVHGDVDDGNRKSSAYQQAPSTPPPPLSVCWAYFLFTVFSFLTVLLNSLNLPFFFLFFPTCAIQRYFSTSPI